METETIKSLHKLKEEVSLEFENVHEYLWQKERAINGLIDGRIYDIEAEIAERLNTTFNEDIDVEDEPRRAIGR